MKNVLYKSAPPTDWLSLRDLFLSVLGVGFAVLAASALSVASSTS